jgi:hypothetical protein
MFKVGDTVRIREDAFYAESIRGVDAVVIGSQVSPRKFYITFVDGGRWEEWSIREGGAWILPEELEMRLPREPDWEI